MIYLTRSDPAHNISRFYALRLQPDLFGQVCLVRKWGRLGSTGTVRCEVHATEAGARSALHDRIKRKWNRGYRSPAFSASLPRTSYPGCKPEGPSHACEARFTTAGSGPTASNILGCDGRCRWSDDHNTDDGWTATDETSTEPNLCEQVGHGGTKCRFIQSHAPRAVAPTQVLLIEISNERVSVR